MPLWRCTKHANPGRTPVLPHRSDCIIPRPITKVTCLPIFSAITLKKIMKKMLLAPMGFQELTLDALIDSGTLVNCLSETEYQKLTTTNVIQAHCQKTEPPPSKLKFDNGDNEPPTKTITLQFEISNWIFKETFIVAKRITRPILCLIFLKNNSTILDVSRELLHIPILFHQN